MGKVHCTNNTLMLLTKVIRVYVGGLYKLQGVRFTQEDSIYSLYEHDSEKFPFPSYSSLMNL
jgi:hypothetical protein